MRIFVILAVALLSWGCHRSYLSCRSEYLYPPYLASFQVNTPDPKQACFCGQQIIVSWSLPKHYRNLPLNLRLNIRYGNREIETVSIPIATLSGWSIHRLINEDYWCKGGILSFQAEILQEGEIITQWAHYLWAKIIEIPEH